MNIDLSPYKGLIFDMDGTLIDSMPAHIESWRLTAERFDFPFSASWFHERGGKPSPKIIQDVNLQYALSLDPDRVAQYKQQAFFQLDSENARIDETCAILDKYKSSKKIAVGTGAKKNSAVALLRKNHLLEDLDALVTSSDVDNHKPHPDTFLKACELLGLKPEECIVFEDTELGRQAAHAGGMDCIMVTEQGLVFYPVGR